MLSASQNYVDNIMAVSKEDISDMKMRLEAEVFWRCLSYSGCYLEENKFLHFCSCGSMHVKGAHPEIIFRMCEQIRTRKRHWTMLRY
jgi:hypothetical protein